MKYVYLIHSLTVRIPAEYITRLQGQFWSKPDPFFKAIKQGRIKKGLYKSSNYEFKTNRYYYFFYSDFSQELFNEKIDTKQDIINKILRDIKTVATLKKGVNYAAVLKISKADVKIDISLPFKDIRILRNMVYFNKLFRYQQLFCLVEGATIYASYNKPRFKRNGNTDIFDCKDDRINNYARVEVMYAPIYQSDEHGDAFWFKPDNEEIKFRWELRYSETRCVERFIMGQKPNNKHNRKYESFLDNFFEINFKNHFIKTLNEKINYLERYKGKYRFRYKNWLEKYDYTEIGQYVIDKNTNPRLPNVDIIPGVFTQASEIKTLITWEILRIQGDRVNEHFDFVDSVNKNEQNIIHQEVMHRYAGDHPYFEKMTKTNEHVSKVVKTFKEKRKKMNKKKKYEKALNKISTNSFKELEKWRKLILHLLNIDDLIQIITNYKTHLENIEIVPYVPDN